MSEWNERIATSDAASHSPVLRDAGAKHIAMMCEAHIRAGPSHVK